MDYLANLSTPLAALNAGVSNEGRRCRRRLATPSEQTSYSVPQYYSDGTDLADDGGEVPGVLSNHATAMFLSTSNTSPVSTISTHPPGCRTIDTERPTRVDLAGCRLRGMLAGSFLFV